MDTNTQPQPASKPVKYPFASAQLSKAELEAAITSLQAVQEQLPNLVGLTTLERRRMAKLGTKSRGFVDGAIEAAKTDPGILPGSISLEMLLTQDEMLRNLSLLQTRVADLKSKLDDSVTVTGSWLYGAARTVYSVMKTPAASGELREQKSAMGQRFKRKASSKQTSETTN
jgi:hypothetical protein